jgi:protein-tyrosine phosphatase
MTALLQRRNLRDLGGLPARDGLVIAPRRLFRSSAPSHFDADERRELGSLGLRCAIDLRTTAERDPLAPSAFPADVQVLHLPLFEAVRGSWSSPSDQRPEATAKRYFEMLEDGLQTVAAVVRAVSTPGARPLIVSCTAGRDRTGIVVACLLDLIGVADETIAADYARSDPFDPETGRAHAGTIHALLELIRRRYGGTHRMLATRGLAAEVAGRLRRGLLVPRDDG